MSIQTNFFIFRIEYDLKDNMNNFCLQIDFFPFTWIYSNIN